MHYSRDKWLPLDFSPPHVPLVGWPADLLHGGPSFQLSLASLDLENLLLDEFEYSGDRRYYRAARDRILAFANWEEQQRKPIAFLWNDHAIAARIAVIVRFWRYLRVMRMPQTRRKHL